MANTVQYDEAVRWLIQQPIGVELDMSTLPKLGGDDLSNFNTHALPRYTEVKDGKVITCKPKILRFNDYVEKHKQAKLNAKLRAKESERYYDL